MWILFLIDFLPMCDEGSILTDDKKNDTNVFSIDKRATT